MSLPTPEPAAVAAFWAVARPALGLSGPVPEAWAFDEVSAEHARREGEGDLSLAYWREVHQRFFTEYAEHDRGFSPTMPVVLQSFEVLFAR